MKEKINSIKNFTTKFDHINKGQNILVVIGTDIILTKSPIDWTSYISPPMTFYLDGKELIDAINCSIIAVEND